MSENRAFRFYARILNLYPRSFQLRFKAAMLQTFKDQYAYTASRQKVGMRFWLETIGDVIIAMIKEYLRVSTIRLLIGGIIFWAIYLLPHTPILNINTAPSLLFLSCITGTLYFWWAMSLSKVLMTRLLLTIIAGLGCYFVVQLMSLQWFGYANSFGELLINFGYAAMVIATMLCFIVPGLLLEIGGRILRGRKRELLANSAPSNKNVLSN